MDARVLWGAAPSLASPSMAPSVPCAGSGFRRKGRRRGGAPRLSRCVAGSRAGTFASASRRGGGRVLSPVVALRARAFYFLYLFTGDNGSLGIDTVKAIS
jgi:hypothetical protein